MDLYWGGPERRITGLTLRILGVNAIALLILAIGIIYLGQYKTELITAKLETFKTEVEMVAAAISEGAIEDVEMPNDFPFAAARYETRLLPSQARQMAKRMSDTMFKRVELFNKEGTLIADSHRLGSPDSTIRIQNLQPPQKHELQSVQILKNTAAFIIDLMPERSKLPLYPDIKDDKAASYPNVPSALKGQISLSAWETEEGRLFLSAAAPLIKDNQIMGAAYLTSQARDIEDAIGQVWADVLQVFSGTLVLTTILSIYLSGVIARPLRRLMRAAEKMRTNKDRSVEIPDLSHRHDEIGELSLVLRDMTKALWDRIDTIESFAADVSHELKNPLTSLKSAVETAAIVKKKSDQKKLLDIISHDIERLDRLITDISHASRLDAELARESFRKLDINKLLYDLVDLYKDPLERKDGHNGDGRHLNQAERDGTTITLNTDQDKAIKIWGLEGRLLQVFQNLLGNALSFTPEEGGKVAIKITTTQPGEVKIEITDNGPGIPDKKLKTIFERFYSERPKHEDYGRHSGLGLSICKQIVEAHNGAITAKNVKQKGKNKGARFIVTLNRI